MERLEYFNMGQIQNPILEGFYPDPSICRVSDDYYLVTSTFSYAPGVPIFHSKDLMHWNQIGHVLERESQLKLDHCKMSEGIYAPTIRYHKGIYYMVTTNVAGGGNFYVTSDKPEGPWSDPIYLGGAEGIDPSLYFEDNKCYYIGQRTKKDAAYFGDCEIWIQELDLVKQELVGEIHSLWDGAFKNAIWPEAPHLYKRGAYYYLLIAEGGTDFEHSISVARSKEIFGPYESCPNNPIITHRHLGRTSKIQNVGHGDLIDTPDGQWYILMLGTRPIERRAPLGRETFIAEVIWEDDWPVINPGEGKLREIQEINLPEYKMIDKTEENSNIKWKQVLDNRCVFFRFPEKELYQINDDETISLKLLPQTISDNKSPAYIGTRVTSLNFSIETTVKFQPLGSEEAGLIYLHNELNYVKLVMAADDKNNKVVKIVICEGGKEILLYMDEIKVDESKIKIFLDGLYLSCFIDENIIIDGIDVRNLTSEVTNGFVGCTMGIYGTTNHDTHSNEKYAVFSELTLN